MKTRRVKTNRQKLMKQLDLVSRKLVYLRDDYTCQHCGKRSETDYQASHVIPVSAGSKLRWDEQNMKVLCYNCHLHWWHKNPLEAAEWFTEKFPERRAYLEANRGIKKFSISELQDLLEELTARLDALT